MAQIEGSKADDEDRYGAGAVDGGPNRSVGGGEHDGRRVGIGLVAVDRIREETAVEPDAGTVVGEVAFVTRLVADNLDRKAVERLRADDGPCLGSAVAYRIGPRRVVVQREIGRSWESRRSSGPKP